MSNKDNNSEYAVPIKFGTDDLNLHILYNVYRKVTITLDQIPCTFEEFIGALAVVYSREIYGMLK